MTRSKALTRLCEHGGVDLEDFRDFNFAENQIGQALAKA
jgi:hypothetical protein